MRKRGYVLSLTSKPLTDVAVSKQLERHTLRLQEVFHVNEKEYLKDWQCESFETRAAYEDALEVKRAGLELKVKQFLDSRKI